MTSKIMRHTHISFFTCCCCCAKKKKKGNKIVAIIAVILMWHMDSFVYHTTKVVFMATFNEILNKFLDSLLPDSRKKKYNDMCVIQLCKIDKPPAFTTKSWYFVRSMYCFVFKCNFVKCCHELKMVFPVGKSTKYCFFFRSENWNHFYWMFNEVRTFERFPTK